jgi:predicted dehydrogenase
MSRGRPARHVDLGNTGTLPRRTFLVGSTAAATAAVARQVAAASDTIGVGLIGYGLIGKRHLLDLREEPDVRLVAISDCHQGRLEEARALVGGKVRAYADFRRLLDDRDVDAVFVATPDHWHALMTMMACAAGKDVYVEKPLTLFPREGVWMQQLAQRYRRVVQVGTQQRSFPHYARARELIRDGHLGQIVSVRMHAFRNVMPGFGNPPDGPPPEGFDWDMFLGPAPLRPYNPNRGLYHFRWFWDTSGGQMTNLGQHALDIVDWFLGPLELKRVVSFGGRYALKDNGQTPDTQDAIFDFGSFTAVWSHREASRGEREGEGLVFYGTKGSLSISRSGFTVTPDPIIPPENAVPQWTEGGQPVGGVVPRRLEGPPRMWTTALSDRNADQRNQFRRHHRNFFEGVKSRQTPVSDLASGHRVATWCHLANISLQLGRSLTWDAARETVVGDDEAAGRLVRPYRAPWDAQLASLLGQ